MIPRTSEDDINENRELWRYIDWWMEKCRFTPETIARTVKLSPASIKRGLRGDYVPVTDHIYYFALAFNIIGIEYRKEYDANPGASLPPYDKLRTMLKPQTQETLWVDWGCQ